MTNLEIIEIETNEQLPHYLDSKKDTSFTFDAWMSENPLEDGIEVHGTIDINFEHKDTGFTHAFGSEEETTTIIDSVDVTILKPSFNSEEEQSIRLLIESYVEQTYNN